MLPVEPIMTSQINRREFLKAFAMAGAGVSFGGWIDLTPEQALAAVVGANAHGLKTNITPIALADDCARITSAVAGAD